MGRGAREPFGRIAESRGPHRDLGLQEPCRRSGSPCVASPRWAVAPRMPCCSRWRWSEAPKPLSIAPLTSAGATKHWLTGSPPKAVVEHGDFRIGRRRPFGNASASKMGENARSGTRRLRNGRKRPFGNAPASQTGVFARLGSRGLTAWLETLVLVAGGSGSGCRAPTGPPEVDLGVGIRQSDSAPMLAHRMLALTSWACFRTHPVGEVRPAGNAAHVRGRAPGSARPAPTSRSPADQSPAPQGSRTRRRTCAAWAAGPPARRSQSPAAGG